MARLAVALCAWALLLHGALAFSNAMQPFNLSRTMPIAAKNFYPYDVFVTKTRTQPSFWQPLLREKNGKWEHFAEQIINWGRFERHITRAFIESIGNECRANSDALVLDVGGFSGYYTVLGALLGCQVEVWEAHPQNVQLLQVAIMLNRVWSKVMVRENICSNATEPQRFSGLGLDGHVSGTYHNTDNANRANEMTEGGLMDDPDEGALVQPLSLDDAVPPGKKVLLLKMDVEGHEPHVLFGAKRLLATKAIQKILLEYNMWRSMTVNEGVAMVGKLMTYGYHCQIQPTNKCLQTQPVKDMEHIRTISIQLQENKYPCGEWLVYLLCTLEPAATGTPVRNSES